MEASHVEDARRILLALADLAPSGEQRTATLTVPTELFRWLDLTSARLFEATGERSKAPTPEAADDVVPTARVDRRFAEELASVDRLRPEQRSLRVGWLFVAGRTTDDSGRARRVFHPLVTVPVRVDRGRGLGPSRLVPAGDVELSALIEDLDERRRLEATIDVVVGSLHGSDGVALAPATVGTQGAVREFALAAARAAGLTASHLVAAGERPQTLQSGSELVVVAGVGVFATHETSTASRAGSLRAWASTPLSAWTAFHSLYLDAEPPVVTPAPEAEPPGPIGSPFLLTPAQRDAVARSRRDHVTVVSGAPGTGKSHTVVAIACEALGRGERVLVAARSDATVDALLDLFERAPGPAPVVFGSSERREALAARLAAGQLRPLSEGEVRRARDAHDVAREAARAARRNIADRLRAEALAASSSAGHEAARRKAPGLFDPDTDLADVERLLASAASPARGWWRRRRQHRALRSLRAAAQATTDVAIAELTEAIAVARAARLATRLVADGGLEIGSGWAELRDLEDSARRATGEWLAAEGRSDARLNRATLPTVGALATALRSGRAARRDQLARLDVRLTQALPLWVGSLPDIDDLLPPATDLFDLVILDEASSIDQPLAVPALLRAPRCVIVGDPQQLRHVSFLSDERLRRTITANGLDARPMVAARLDVRRNSAFDLGAAVAPVIVLDEHFRSDPHLVEFVAQRLYRGAVHVATRTPRSSARDCVNVVRVDGRRDSNGVIEAEVARAIEEVERLRRAGTHSVGLITPFRAQADALEAAALRAFTIDDLEALDLRIGTVHAFQGNERDVVVASLGVGPGQDGSSWRFVEDPHLFTVLVTRARRQLTVLASADPPPGGLVADYLAQASSPLGDPPPGAPPSAWAAAVATDLTTGGAAVLPAYRTGRHVIDLCVATPGADVAIECGVHPAGPEEHIDRHLSLLRSGWQVLEAFPSRWSDRRSELVIELLHQLDTHAER